VLGTIQVDLAIEIDGVQIALGPEGYYSNAPTEKKKKKEEGRSGVDLD
jgi:hypothetical protein